MPFPFASVPGRHVPRAECRLWNTRRARLALLLALLGCASPPPALSAVPLTRLPGWSVEAVARAAPALLSGCQFLAALPADQALPAIAPGMSAEDWRRACAELVAASHQGDAALAQHFADRFVALAPADSGVAALITGYYEPEFAGSLTPDLQYRWPLYALPASPLRFDRAAISAGALDGQGLELLFLADPIDAYFLQVQGSGRVRLPDGRVVRLGYAGSNGRDYVAIGKPMVEAGLIPKDQVSMQSIRAWLMAHPESIQQWLDRNPRYVFFREYEGPGPVGALGTPLTALASVAVDPEFVAMGTPMWLNAAWPANAPGQARGAALQILVVAQDKGGAIKGTGRIDLFWGTGALAEEMAGRMRIEGSYYPIVPRDWASRQGWLPDS